MNILPMNEEDQQLFYHYSIHNYFSKDLLSHFRRFEFSKGEHICLQDEKLPFFLFLVRGRIKIYASLENGKQLLLRFYEPLEVIGDVEFIDESTTTCSIECLNDCVLFGIDYHYFRQSVFDDPLFLRMLSASLTEKVINRANSSNINLSYALENRLASYLIATTQFEHSNSNLVATNLRELADLLGTSYRHLHRVLKDFESKGLVTRNQGDIIINDPVTLRDMAGEIYK